MIPHAGRACLFARGRSIYCWMKCVCFPLQVPYWNEIFKMLIPRICWLHSMNLFGYNSLNMLTLLVVLRTRKGKSLTFSSLCNLYQGKITQVIGSSFICIYFLAFTCLFSWCFKIEWPQVCFSLLNTFKVSQKCRGGRKYHGSIKEKWTVTKAKSLLVRGLEVSPKTSSARKNAHTFFHKNSMARGCADSQKLNLSDLIWMKVIIRYLLVF